MSPLFELQNINFSYAGGLPVLNDANLKLFPQERLCLTGDNGAGKSTLLRLMVGLLKPGSGTLTAFGEVRVEEKDFYDVRRLAGLVFQDPDDQLFCPTVAEDIAFGPYNLGKSKEETTTIVDDVLARLHLTHFRNRITHKLSGGEKRLVTLAAVLAMEPQVLLLDEPTNALDDRATENIVAVLQSLPQAMIIVSHDSRFRERMATRTVHLQGGRIISGAFHGEMDADTPSHGTTM